MGRKHTIPTLDSRIFTVKLPDGEEKDIKYTFLAEQLFSKLESKGNQYRLFKGIIGHQRLKNSVDKADGFRQAGRKKVCQKTVAGYNLELEWKYSSASWLPLREVKETNSVNVAIYARDNDLME